MAFCTNWSHGTKSAILDGKKAWHPPLGHRKQRKVKLDRLEFLCVRIYYILLPSSMVDFVPCDQLVQKAHYMRMQYKIILALASNAKLCTSVQRRQTENGKRRKAKVTRLFHAVYVHAMLNSLFKEPNISSSFITNYSIAQFQQTFVN